VRTTTLRFGSFASLLVTVAAACGAPSDAEPSADPPIAEPPPRRPPDAGPDLPITPRTCKTTASLATTCEGTKPAPTTRAAIEKFVEDNAIPIRCDGDGDGDDAVWDLRPLIDLYGDQKMFMMGEVHGQNEIGILSARVLEELASKGLVNLVGYELPMDFEAGFDRWVQSGQSASTERMLDAFAPNFFGAILTRKARELVEDGASLRVAAVDIPMSPHIAVQAIEGVAAKLTAHKETVLATLPTSAAEPPSTNDVEEANQYFDHIMAVKDEVCAELSEADCDRLVAMTHALWASTLVYERGGSELWFARREEVIYYNIKTKMAAAGARMLLHMGAAHTNKNTFSAGSRMAKEYGRTRGQVFSVAPAFGDGSVIWYGGEMDLPGSPESIVSALSHDPEHPSFVSTTRPGQRCEANPIGLEAEEWVGGGTRAELYDGYVHYGKLTSERRPFDTTFLQKGDGGGQSAFATFRARVEEKEREAIAAGALRRLR
jgi:hypothetical protein